MERRGPAICNASNIGEGKGEMTKASIDLQDLRRRIYVKAKAEPSWRFWGLYVHVCKMETLREAYEMAKQNNGAPGVDGVTFEAIEAQGGWEWLVGAGSRFFPPRCRRSASRPCPSSAGRFGRRRAFQ